VEKSIFFSLAENEIRKAATFFLSTWKGKNQFITRQILGTSF
jgi:hypothetical protein